MVPAPEYQVVTDRLLFWQAYDPKVKCQLSSVAYRTKEGWILVDPIALSPEAWPNSWQLEPPLAIVLTNANHERSAALFQRAFACPIWGSELAKSSFEGEVNHYFHEGMELHGLKVFPLSGAVIGETALISPEGLLFLGDAVINLEETGLALLPAKYCLDPQQNRASLKSLLDYEFSIVTFAHGLPLRKQAQERLRQLLEEN